MILRKAAKASIFIFAAFALIVVWWQWPEDTLSGAWAGQARGQTLELAFLEHTTGVIQGHGAIVSDGTRIVAAAGTVHGTRIRQRITLNLSTGKQEIFTLFVQLNSRGQLEGQYFQTGAKALPITLEEVDK
jgi:hypothetical protein